MGQFFPRRVDGYNFPFFVGDRARVSNLGTLSVDAPDGPGRIEYAFFMAENATFVDNIITVTIDGVVVYSDVLSNFIGAYGAIGISGPYGLCILSGGRVQYQLLRDLDYETSASIDITNFGMIDLVIGNAPGAGVANHVAERCHWQKFTALYSCDVESIILKCGAACQAMVALYADNAGTPGVVLTSCADTTMIAGYNLIPVAPHAIVAGTSYWLAFNSDTAHVQYLAGAGQVNRYKDIAYAGFAFPDNPAGLTSVTTYLDEIGGYSGSFFDINFGGRVGL